MDYSLGGMIPNSQVLSQDLYGMSLNNSAIMGSAISYSYTSNNEIHWKLLKSVSVCMQFGNIPLVCTTVKVDIFKCINVPHELLRLPCKKKIIPHFTHVEHRLLLLHNQDNH